jgi:hypothetical protein
VLEAEEVRDAPSSSAFTSDPADMIFLKGFPPSPFILSRRECGGRLAQLVEEPLLRNCCSRNVVGLETVFGMALLTEATLVTTGECL